ncbi:MAG: hypothetical protein J5793_02600 [Clostridia bacterium]|nr:hypothetical protein [Clostridia bacterium]
MNNRGNSSSFKKPSYSAIFWGVLLVLSAVLIILDATTEIFSKNEINPLKIIIAVLMVSWAVFEIVKFRFANVVFPVAVIFGLFQANIFGKTVIPVWVLIIVTVLLVIGLNLIIPKKKKPSLPVGGKASDVVGAKTYNFDAADLSDACVKDNVGSTQVYFTNISAYAGDGTLTVVNNMGKIVIHVPNDWNVYSSEQSNVGNVSIPSRYTIGAKQLNLNISQNLGSISVVYE